MKKDQYEAILLKNNIEKRELEEDINILKSKKINLIEVITNEERKLTETTLLLKQNVKIQSHMLKSTFNNEKREEARNSLKKVEEVLEKLNREYLILLEREKLVKDIVTKEERKKQKRMNKKEENLMIEED